MRTTDITSKPHIRLSLSAETQALLRESCNDTQIFATVTAAFLNVGFADPQVSVLSSEITLGFHSADYEMFENASRGSTPVEVADEIVNDYLMRQRDAYVASTTARNQDMFVY